VPGAGPARHPVTSFSGRRARCYARSLPGHLDVVAPGIAIRAASSSTYSSRCCAAFPHRHIFPRVDRKEKPVLCKESAKPISLAFWHDQPSASISTTDECGVDARTRVRRGGSEQDANDSPRAFLHTLPDPVIGIHADRLSRAGSRACEASPYERLRSTGHRHRRQINRLTVHTGDSTATGIQRSHHDHRHDLTLRSNR
jgi:hypothetical protein